MCAFTAHVRPPGTATDGCREQHSWFMRAVRWAEFATVWGDFSPGGAAILRNTGKTRGLVIEDRHVLGRTRPRQRLHERVDVGDLLLRHDDLRICRHVVRGLA